MRKSSIPNLFTFANLSFGVFSILATLNEDYFLAAIFVIIAALIDRYDGRVARFLNVSSELGKELDSLADLVSFGVAPSILIYSQFSFNSFGPKGLLGYCVLIIFPICGAFRLARYNLAEFDGVFRGVPITIAGSLMAIFALITTRYTVPMALPIILLLIFSYLMVSNFKLKKL
ncbi:CDP-diacylglycerol--serine O-phosphatidyltransferase [Clostridium sp. YIM B02505]|uniref:CDP-diacylglycerol--serine O-phosphatidyltransferase n=1 Tax=Clostridium yunnanense TaxID=2800325 RepID=A0ABS1EX42_9CLOT|nr:CDP-diacylglycerol--serine O-phosphatidyltransferase [Clostridium yunnanense]MBK1813968.1 CDP-diacylglycerol--serine O-phosphatidyltransferase [Clostridium yunnanense]